MSDSESKSIRLPEQFVQLQLGALKEIVDHHRADASCVQFDAEEVETVDGAAIQFLHAVAKLQADKKQDALVINACEVIANAISDMGLTDQISLNLAAEN
ncbi:MAG: hypothetical protein KTR32_15510 [Granulosicoccus sp.]|nr:hypothetical protein [Granulosicoccus sp.]